MGKGKECASHAFLELEKGERRDKADDASNLQIPPCPEGDVLGRERRLLFGTRRWRRGRRRPDSFADSCASILNNFPETEADDAGVGISPFMSANP